MMAYSWACGWSVYKTNTRCGNHMLGGCLLYIYSMVLTLSQDETEKESPVKHRIYLVPDHNVSMIYKTT